MQRVNSASAKKSEVVSGAFVGMANLKEIRPFTKADAARLKALKGGTDWWGPNVFAWVLEDVQRIGCR